MTLYEILEIWKFYYILESCGINMQTMSLCGGPEGGKVPKRG